MFFACCLVLVVSCPRPFFFSCLFLLLLWLWLPGCGLCTVVITPLADAQVRERALPRWHPVVTSPLADAQAGERALPLAPLVVRFFASFLNAC